VAAVVVHAAAVAVADPMAAATGNSDCFISFS
jgi:hypothetical protein